MVSSAIVRPSCGELVLFIVDNCPNCLSLFSGTVSAVRAMRKALEPRSGILLYCAAASASHGAKKFAFSGVKFKEKVVLF